MRLLCNPEEEWLGNYSNRLLFELYIAYLEARRGGKRGTFDEHKFEVHEFENLVKLRDLILSREYRPSRGTAHIIHNPVMREIFAACFVDRIVHHYIYNCVYDWWDARFINNSFSCREGKGTSFGIQTLGRQLQSASQNYSQRVFVIKMDIQGYFMSLPRNQLLERALWGLQRQFKDNHGEKYSILRFLWEQTILDDPCRGVKRKGWPEEWAGLPDSKSLFKQPKGTGIVIGNLTSQLLSNIYLDQLDRYITIDLGWKYYGRYVDDFYLIVKESELPRALKDVERIKEFLLRIGLTLHPKKFSVQPMERGVTFIGGVAYPGRIYPGRRIIKNARRAFLEVEAGIRDIESIISYMGHMKHFSSRKILSELFLNVGWDYAW